MWPKKTRFLSPEKCNYVSKTLSEQQYVCSLDEIVYAQEMSLKLSSLQKQLASPLLFPTVVWGGVKRATIKGEKHLSYSR